MSAASAAAPVIAVLVDIVRSRDAADRAGAQAAVRRAFELADAVVPPVQALWATAGDEFQVVYADPAAALLATTLVRTTLPDGLECRFGVGVGEIRDVETSASGHVIQDGSAWWHAREAIDAVHDMQQRGHPALRTWIRGGDRAQEAAFNAFLSVRDHVLSRMKARERRIAAQYLAGTAQIDIARRESISQPAVSQALSRSGALELRLALDALRSR